MQEYGAVVSGIASSCLGEDMLVESGKSNKEKGFTLLEVLIAISIFSIGILAVGTMQISAINGNASARTHTEAVTWAADRVERLMGLPYNHTDLDAANNPHPATEGEGVYNIVWNITDNVNNFKEISVTVNLAGRGGQQSISLDFIKAQDI